MSPLFHQLHVERCGTLIDYAMLQHAKLDLFEVLDRLSNFFFSHINDSVSIYYLRVITFVQVYKAFLKAQLGNVIFARLITIDRIQW